MALQIEKPGKRTEYILKADRESSAPTKFIAAVMVIGLDMSDSRGRD